MDDLIINEETQRKLESHYNNIKKEYSPKKPLTLNLLIKSKKNIQDFILNNTVINSEQLGLSIDEIEELQRKSFIHEKSKKERIYCLTLKGMIILEYGLYDCYGQIEKMLNDFNRLYFEDIVKESKQKLTTREKVVLLGLLGLMAITEDYTVKLNDANEEYFKQSVNQVVLFLSEFPNLIDESIDKLWKREISGETPIKGELRRLNDLPTKTENVYKNDKGHYLNLLKNNSIDIQSLEYLLKRIFGETFLSYEAKNKLMSLLDEIQRSYSPFVFYDLPPFDVYEVRNQIRKIIENYGI